MASTPFRLKLNKDFCRCCHSEGSFVSIGSSVVDENVKEEVIMNLLRDFLDLNIPMIDGIYKYVTYKICQVCLNKLQEARNFKTQVLNCEEKFQEYYQQGLLNVTKMKKEEVIIVKKEEESKVKIEVDEEVEMNAEFLDSDIEYDMEMKQEPIDESDDDYVEPPIKLPSSITVRKRGRPKKVVQSIKKAGLKKKKPITKAELKKADVKALEATLEKIAKKDDSVNEEPKRPRNKTKEHNEYKFEDGVFICCKCSKKELLVKDMIQHVTAVHGASLTIIQMAHGWFTKSTECYNCNLCTKELKTLDGIRQHIVITHFNYKKMYPCEICNLQCISVIQRNVHKLQAHQIDDRIQCNACDGIFNSKQYLLRHMQSYHLMDRLQKCKFCDYECYGSRNMYKHKIKHKTTRDHQCRFCKKTFLRKKTMTLHEKIHTGEKDKICKECGQGFVQKASLNYHMSKYHPEIRF